MLNRLKINGSSGIFKRRRDFLGSPGLRLHAFTEGVMSSVPGQGTNKIPYATWHDQKKKKKKKSEREGRMQQKYLPPETWEMTIGSHGFLEHRLRSRDPPWETRIETDELVDAQWWTIKRVKNHGDTVTGTVRLWDFPSGAQPPSHSNYLRKNPSGFRQEEGKGHIFSICNMNRENTLFF